MRRLALAAATALAVAACEPATVTVIPESDLPQDVFGSPSPGELEELPDRATVYFVRSRRLAPASRPLEEAASLPEALLEALLSGPPGRFRTAIPAETRLISVDVREGVAWVDLSDEFERSAPGRILALRVAQVVYTVTEAPGVIAVRFSIEGVPKGVLAGEDRVVQRPVARGDYEQFDPEADPETDPEADGEGDGEGGGEGGGESDDESDAAADGEHAGQGGRGGSGGAADPPDGP